MAQKEWEDLANESRLIKRLKKGILFGKINAN